MSSARSAGTGGRSPARGRHRRLPIPSVARALRWTLASVFIPGLAHVAAGRRRTGWLVTGSFVALVCLAVIVAVATPQSQYVRLAVDPGALELVMVGCLALACAWALIVMRSWAVHRPEQLRAPQRALALLVVTGLSLGVAAPFAFGAHTAFVQRDLITTLFSEEPDEVVAMAPAGPATQPAPAVPAGEFGPAQGTLAGKSRVNVLLLGGDGADNRVGIRTDTMILASIDTATGDTVLISLPRNLQHAQFPTDTEMAQRYPYPDGFDQMLNAVYTYAEANPDVAPGARYPGGEMIKRTFSYTIGQPVDYFVLVNIEGFRDLINALGGVTIDVPTRLPIGGRTDANGRTVTPPSGYLEPGKRKLNGHEALWYGRSRYGSDDYARMGRQRCLLGAIAKQASPLNVLRNFRDLAGAAKRIILTDIPQSALADLLLLAQKAGEAEVSSVTFVRSADFDPARPTFSHIQEKVRSAIAESEAGPPTPAPAALAGQPVDGAGDQHDKARKKKGKGKSGPATPAPVQGSADAAPADATEAAGASLDAVCNF